MSVNVHLPLSKTRLAIAAKFYGPKYRSKDRYHQPGSLVESGFF